MKREILLLSALSSICGVGLWMSVDFRKTQERAFNHAMGERAFFQQENKSLRADLAFLESHQKEIYFLTEKGWLCPKNRLIAGEFLQTLRPLLKEVSYRFDPETIKELKENISYKVTQISFETMSMCDVEVYAFIDALLSQFPGVLILRELTLRREESEFIQGKFVVEWVAMGGEN